jgi:septal ring factor EnvC (AmiA/AmiB activator)
VNPDLVVRDAEGKVNTVRYEAVNAMLLNEFLKAHRKMEEQEASITQLKFTVAQQRKDFEAIIAQQQKGMDALRAQFKEQDSRIQKVSEQVELSKTAPKMVNNN